MFKRFFVGLVMVPLFALFYITPAFAAPTIYYETIYVGNIWNSEGQYDDSVPEEDPPNTQGAFVVDSANPNDGDTMTKFELYGSMSSTAQLQFTFYGPPPGGSGLGPVIGQKVYYASDLNKILSVPFSGVWGASFTINDLDPSTTGGQVYLHETWSTDTDISSTGEMIWATPSWASTSGGSTVSTSTSVSGATVNLTVNVTVPPPPDWQQVADTFVNTFINDMPPIPDPPAPPAPQPPPTDSGMPNDPPNGFSDPPIVTPQPPQEQPGDTSDWTSGTSDAVPFSTTGDSSFDIGDPIGSLPHDPPGTQPIPGSSPTTGYTPNPSGYGGAPTTGQSAPQPPGSIPTYNGGTSPIGSAPTPTGTGSISSGGPSPTYSGGSSPTASPSNTGSSTPTYNPGTNAGSTPSYSFPQ